MNKKILWSIAPLALGLALTGCGGNSDSTGNTTDNAAPGANAASNASTQKLSGNVKADGSSTVGPITQAMAESFQETQPGVNITVGISGTGGGLKKFAAGELDIADASRPMKSKEAAAAKANGIEFIELPIAYDGLSIVVNPKNTWATTLSTAELKNIWVAGSKINNWSQIRKGFPNKSLKLYGPGTASGTFDYFVEEILGKGGKCRADYTASEDDNTLVQGVSKDEGALGYFGYAYYEENAAKLKDVAIDSGKGAIKPTAETIKNGTYAPLSRPLFIYVSTKALARPEVKEFVNFYLANAKTKMADVGYVALPDVVYSAVQKRLTDMKTGSVYGGEIEGASLEQLYGAK